MEKESIIGIVEFLFGLILVPMVTTYLGAYIMSYLTGLLSVSGFADLLIFAFLGRILFSGLVLVILVYIRKYIALGFLLHIVAIDLIWNYFII